MVEKEAAVRTAEPRRGSQGAPESMLVLKKNLSGRGSAASGERTSSGSVRIEASANPQRKSRGVSQMPDYETARSV